jgi:hypothetical protein
MVVNINLRMHTGYRALLITSASNLARKDLGEVKTVKVSTVIGHDDSLLSMLCRYFHKEIST